MAMEAGDGMTRSPSQRSTSREQQASVALPEGITRFLHVSSGKKGLCRQVKYRFICQKEGCGCKTVDRQAQLAQLLAKHVECSPAWQPLQQRKREGSETYQARLQQLFSFDMLPSERAMAQSEQATADKPANCRSAQQPAENSAKRQSDCPADKNRPKKKPQKSKGAITQYFVVRDSGSSAPQAVPPPGKHTDSSTSKHTPSSIAAPASVGTNGKAQDNKQDAEGYAHISKITMDTEAAAVKTELEAAHRVYCDSLHDRSSFHELHVAKDMTAQALLGRSVKVFWVDDDAWYTGRVTSFDEQTGQHHVDYKDGSQEDVWMPLERVQVCIQAQEVLEPPSAESVHAWGSSLLSTALSTEHAEGLGDSVQARLRAEGENLQALAAELVVDDTSCRKAYPCGESVWAREKGWPAWPAMVVTAQDAAASVSFGRSAGKNICVRYFGTFEWGQVKPKDVISFADGLEAGLHAKCNRLKSTFLQALQHLDTYLQTGALPDEMVPDDNDDLEDESDEEDEGPKLEGVALPLQLGTLQVLSLGRIEWIHPGFHIEQYLWPVGYKAARSIATPASKHQSVLHECEVVQHPNGSGPLFRVSVGGRTCEARNATAAWAGMYEGASSNARGVHGPRLFGLAHPQVLKLLQQLPDAARCESYKGWHGAAPDAPPMTEAESRARSAAEAGMQQLPEGIRQVSPPAYPEGECQVCREADDTPDNQILQCDACRACVHMECCGVSTIPDGRLWLCDVCAIGAQRAPACALCPVPGGLMKRTTCGRWCHLVCALWTPETIFNGTLVEGASSIPKGRRDLECSCCRQCYGACIQCAASRACFTAFHPLCARANGLFMTPVEDEAHDSEGDNESAPAFPSAAHTPVSKSVLPAQEGSQPASAPDAARSARGLRRVRDRKSRQKADSGRRSSRIAMTEEGQASQAAHWVKLAEDSPSHTPLDILRDAARSSRSVAPQPPIPAADPAVSQAPGKAPPHADLRSGVAAEADTAEHAGASTEQDMHMLDAAKQGEARHAAPGNEQDIAQDQHVADHDAGQRAASGSRINTSAAHPQSGAQHTAQHAIPGNGQETRMTDAHTAAQRADSEQAASCNPQEMPDAGACVPGAAQQTGRGQTDAQPAMGGASTPGHAPMTGMAEHQRTRWGDAQVHISLQLPKVSAPKRRRRQDQNWTEGTALGNGVRLLCFCRRHSAAAQATVAHHPTPSRVASGATAALQNVPGLSLPGQLTLTKPGACSRETPYNHALRRGHRAPEAVAAAIAKRAFVRAVPYLVTEGEGTLAHLHRHANGEIPASTSHTLQSSSEHFQPMFAASSDSSNAAAMQASASKQDQGVLLGVQSVSERFQTMQSTLQQRLTSGKSAIHGWGAFAKVPHKQGEMVIEYCGDLVRPSVADVREKKQYDTLVGAGTYIFRLSQDLNVDATRHGNMAHLLNHSCAPNCFSRNQSTCDPVTGQLQEHIIIFAKADVAVGEELTYDYRFNGEEILPCNCSAPTCRGTVNYLSDDEGEHVMAPRHQLETLEAWLHTRSKPMMVWHLE